MSVNTFSKQTEIDLTSIQLRSILGAIHNNVSQVTNDDNYRYYTLFAVAGQPS